MMRFLFAGSVLFSALLIAGFILMPASWLDFALQRASHGVVGLGNPTGRIWKGSGTVQAILPGGQVHVLGRVRWDLALSELFLARVHAKVYSDDSDRSRLEIRISRAGIELENVQFDFPAGLLGAFSPTLREAALSGKITVRARAFGWSKDEMHGSAEATWGDASSGRVRISPLGTYVIRLNGGVHGLDCAISTLSSSALKLGGNCRWPKNEALQMQLTAEPVESQRQELTPLLRIFGREVRPGVYQLQGLTVAGVSFQ